MALRYLKSPLPTYFAPPSYERSHFSPSSPWPHFHKFRTQRISRKTAEPRLNLFASSSGFRRNLSKCSWTSSLAIILSYWSSACFTLEAPVKAWNARQAEPGVEKALAHAHINETSATHGPSRTVVTISDPLPNTTSVSTQHFARHPASSWRQM